MMNDEWKVQADDEEFWQIDESKREYLISTLYGGLSETINDNLERLRQFQKRAPLNQIAWYVRNLLELQIWVQFCSSSRQNAVEFYEDAICDLVDLNKAPKGRDLQPGERNPEMMALLEKAKLLISTPKKPHEYKRVAEAAAAIGHKDEKHTWAGYYSDQQKILSKFVHPTAMSIVLAIAPQNSSGIRKQFVEAGEEYAREATKRLRESFLAELHNTHAPAVAAAKLQMKKRAGS